MLTQNLAPQPGLDQLDRLVERIGQAGLPVDLHIDGTPRPLPPGLDLTAYRILQEALTNALKYASGAHTQVRVKFDERELRLEVLDAGGGTVGDAAGACRGWTDWKLRAGSWRMKGPMPLAASSC
jgi:signal transduction histidine kinase